MASAQSSHEESDLIKCNPGVHLGDVPLDSVRYWFQCQHIGRKSGAARGKLPLGFVQAKGNILLHERTGVRVSIVPLRIVDNEELGEEQQILFHYTQEESFKLIVNSRAQDGGKGALLKASWNLEQDCDFGVGIYATEMGPDEFDDGIKGILLNNYPRCGPWGGVGEPTESHYHLASHCIPIVAPLRLTLCHPLTHRTADTGPIFEVHMRQKDPQTDQHHPYNPRAHNIYLIRSEKLERELQVSDSGILAQKLQQLKHSDHLVRLKGLRGLCKHGASPDDLLPALQDEEICFDAVAELVEVVRIAIQELEELLLYFRRIRRDGSIQQEAKHALTDIKERLAPLLVANPYAMEKTEFDPRGWVRLTNCLHHWQERLKNSDDFLRR